MKKNVIALLLSVVLAAGSIGATPVFAAEMTAEESVTVEEEASEEIEDADTGLTAGDVSEDETIQAEEEEPAEEEREAEESTEEQSESTDIVVPEETEDDEEAEDHTDEGEPPAEVTENEEPVVIEEETGSEEGREAVQAGDVVDSGTCGDNATWTLTGTGDNLTLTISGSGEIDGYNEGTAPWYSRRTKIRTVVVEDGITYIGGLAFYSLNKLVSVSFPNTKFYIGFRAFSRCASLERIKLPDSLRGIDLRAFEDCSSLKEIHINSIKMWLDLSEDGWIGVPANLYINGKAITNVVIPEDVPSIRANAFSGCTSLKSLTISNSVTSIGMGAFDDCSSLKTVNIPNNSVMKIGFYAFGNCSSLTNITLPEGLTEIEGQAFLGCSSLTNIAIPDSVTWIGDSALFGENLKVRFRGSKEQWNRATGDRYLYYSSITYNCFSVPATFKLSDTSFIYTGKTIKPTVTVTYKGKNLIEGTDYKLVYKNNINTGIATVNVVGIEKYSGTEPFEYKILPGKTTRGDMFNLANNVKVTWNAVPGAKYYKVYREGITDNSESLEPPVIVTTGLVGWDKESYLYNGHAYRYKIVASFTGKDDPTGDSTLSYSKVMYRLKTVVIRSVKNTAPGKVTVTYDRTFSGDSYVLQWSEREDMAGAQSKVVLGAKNTSYTIGGLKKGKTYYISIRVRKKVNGINYYTTFGVPKKITVTK